VEIYKTGTHSRLFVDWTSDACPLRGY